MKKIILTIIALPLLFILVMAVNYFHFENSVNEVSKGTPILKNGEVKEALVVIDIQEGTTGSYSFTDYYQNKSEEIVWNINLLADTAAKYNIPVIFIRTELNNFLINILNDTFAPDSPGSKLDSRLHVVSENIFVKDMADAFWNPKLDQFFVKNGVNKLVVTGLDLSGCINYTLLAADQRNYDICVITDAVLAESDSLAEIKLSDFKQKDYQLITSSQYIESIIN